MNQTISTCHAHYRSASSFACSPRGIDCTTETGRTKLPRTSTKRLCGDWPLLLTATLLRGNGGVDVVVNVVAVVIAVALVLAGGNPETRLPVVKGLVLAGEVDTLTTASGVAATLGQGAGALGQLGRDGGILGDPVGEGILAVLDDAVECQRRLFCLERIIDLRLAGLVSVVGLASLAWSDRVVVDQLQQVLSVAGDDGKLLAVLTHGIELVGEGGLELLAGDVGQLGLSDQGLGLSAHELLLEDNDLGRVGLLVLQLRNLVRNLLLAWARSKHVKPAQ